MSNRILRRAAATDERRSSNRLPIERDVRYKVLGGKKSVTQVGLGKTLNISSGGVLFTTESPLPEGERVELAVSWPAQLNDVLPLKLVALGRLVRTEDTQAAISIERYEFKTRGSGL
jgi:PilZ domain